MTRTKKKLPPIKSRTVVQERTSNTILKPPAGPTTHKNEIKHPTMTQVQKKLTFAAAVGNSTKDVYQVSPNQTEDKANEDEQNGKMSNEVEDTHTDKQAINRTANRTVNLASLPKSVMTSATEANAITPLTPQNSNTFFRKAIRYKVMIEVKKPEEQAENLAPSEQFAVNFRAVFRRMQQVIGDNLCIAAWDPEQQQAYPDITKPEKTPNGSTFDDKQTMNIYTNTYVNSKKENSKVWAQLRLVHEKPIKTELNKIGEALQNAFEDFKFDVRFTRQPNHCQATHVECIGWLYGSTKTISETTFVPAIKKALNLSDKIAFGIQWRVITNKFGKQPPYDQDNPPPSAIHLDIDKRFATLVQKQAGALWKKYHKNKEKPALPNDIQLRLVPCFSSKYSEARKTPTTEENVILMAEKQQYFVTHCIEKVDVPFVKLLDSPLSDTNPITLRQAMMARAPPDDPTKRLIHNVDMSWNDRNQAQATTIKPLLSYTHDFISSLIPEMVYRYGQECQKWFTSDGISYFDNVTWDPKKMATTSTTDTDTQELVDEDLWGLGDDWKLTSQMIAPTATKVGTSILKNKTRSNVNKDRVTTTFLETDDDIKSFASAFGVEHSTASPTGEDTGQTKKGSMVKLSSEVLTALNSKKGPVDHETCSMSTAARTTESTRVKLQDARQQIDEQLQEIELLRKMIAVNRVTQTQTNPKSTSGANDPTVAANTPLPNSSSGSSETSDLEVLSIQSFQLPNPDSETQMITYMSHDDEPIPENLNSKFSAAKLTAIARKPPERSPPKKVRYTRSHTQNNKRRTQRSKYIDSEESSSSSDGDDTKESVCFRAHHPEDKRTQAVIDMVDDGSGA